MTGSIRKRGTTWTAYWWTPAAGGARRQASKGGFHTKKEAQAHLTTTLESLRTGSYVKPKSVTFAAYAEDWLTGVLTA